MRSLLMIAALASLVPQHAAAGGRSGSMGVSAVVQRSATFRLIETFQQFTPTNLDFSKGYVDVPGMVQVVINSGGATRRVLNVTVEVEPNPELVRSIRMLARAEGSAEAARERPAAEDAASIALGYRVQLTERRPDGTFAVPVTLTVNL